MTLTLYTVKFDHRHVASKAFSVLVSERNQKDAVKRARVFVGTMMRERIVLDEARAICKTPDDVLELA